jgi:uncharacterized membrane protein (UPF0127 family)
MNLRLASFGLGLMSLFSLGCKDTQPQKIEEKVIAFKEEGSLSIINASEKTLAHFTIEIADTPYERETGLMYRKSLRESHGMLFVFDQEQILSFYMKNTPLSLDLLFLNGELEIIHIYKNARPNDPNAINSKFPARYVLELAAGTSDKYQIQTGDFVQYTTL